jgi:hypothetical protein
MPEDLIIKYLREYSKDIKNMILIKKYNFDNYIKRFNYTIMILSLFIFAMLLNLVGLHLISNIFFIFLIIFFTANIFIWSYIDIVKVYKFKKLCLKLNMNRLEIKKMLKRYRI